MPSCISTSSALVCASLGAGAAASSTIFTAGVDSVTDSVCRGADWARPSTSTSSSDGSYEPVSRWRVRSSTEWMPSAERVSNGRKSSARRRKM